MTNPAIRWTIPTDHEDDEPPYDPHDDPWSPHYDDGIPRGLTGQALTDYIDREERATLPRH